MTVNPAIAPYVPTYATYTPYVSPTEFLNANTGVDVSQLVPAGSQLTQTQALLDLLARSSSEADRICQKPLAATVDIVQGEFRIFRDGTVRVPVPYKPIVAITAVSVGYAINAMVPLTDLSGIVIGPKVARIPVPSLASSAVSFSQHPPAMAERGKLFVLVTYVNGWMHSELASGAVAGLAQIAPQSTVGAVPGLPFTIKDGALTENCAIAPNYVYGSTPVLLAAPLLNAHGAGATISALPPFVKNAVINIGRSLAKAKGTKAVVMGSIAGQKVSSATKTQKIEPGGDQDMAAAEKTLRDLRRTV
jgi:hypothetical protein